MTSNAALGVQAAVVLLVAYGGAVLRYLRTRDVLDLTGLVSAITGSLFALPALSLIGSKDDLWQPGAESALSRALLVVLAALVVFHAVVWLAERRPLTSEPVAPAQTRLLGKDWIIWVLCAGAVASAALLQVETNAIFGRAADPLDLTSTDQLPWWYFFAQGGLTLSHLAFWLVLASGRPVRSVLFLLTGALAVFLSATQGRLMLVNFVIPVALIIHYHRRRFTVATLAVAAVVALTYFLVWDAYREDQAGSRPSGLGLSPAGVWKGITNNLDYTDSFIRLVLVDAPPEYGSTYLAPATKPIPRSVWSDKPFGANALLTELILPGTLAVGFSRASSAVTEGYLNFGLVGPALVYAVLGLGCAALARWHARRRGDPEATVWYAIWFLAILTLVRTDAQIATTFLGYYLLPLLAFTGFLRVRRGWLGSGTDRRGSGGLDPASPAPRSS